MTLLVSFVGGWGHAEPLLPLAALAAERGHAVTVAGQAAVLPRLAAIGYATVPVGPDTIQGARRPLVPVDRAMEAEVARDHFVGTYALRRAPLLRELVERDRVDLVVCDEMDAGAVVAAELAGVPCITVSVLAAGRLASDAVVGPAWARVRDELWLPPDPDGARFGGTLRITPAPASFRDPAVPAPFALHPVRPPIVDQVARSAERTRVYATLGTVFDVESGDLFARLVHALADLDRPSLLTIGDHVGRDELPDAPEHVDVRPFVPLVEALDGCAAVVCHGGSGTLVAALSLGIPAVVLPMGADQPDNADRCEDLGVGIALDAITASAADIGSAVGAVLRDERIAADARALATEAAVQPRIAELPELTDLLG